MKKNIVAELSLGETFENPNPMEIKKLLFNYSDKDWTGGSGDSVFTCYENDLRKSKISLLGSYGEGFAISFKKNEGEYSYLISGNDTGEVVKSAVGGNQFKAYKKYFVSKETAWQALEYFFATGERLENLNWTTNYEVPDDF